MYQSQLFPTRMRGAHRDKLARPLSALAEKGVPVLLEKISLAGQSLPDRPFSGARLERIVMRADPSQAALRNGRPGSARSISNARPNRVTTSRRPESRGIANTAKPQY